MFHYYTNWFRGLPWQAEKSQFFSGYFTKKYSNKFNYLMSPENFHNLYLFLIILAHLRNLNYITHIIFYLNLSYWLYSKCNMYKLLQIKYYTVLVVSTFALQPIIMFGVKKMLPQNSHRLRIHVGPTFKLNVELNVHLISNFLEIN